MNEANVWRHALAQQIAPHYRTNPKVRVVALAGSVALGYADRFSDIYLLVFWAELPTDKERWDIIQRAGGKRRSRFPAHTKAGAWSEKFEVGGVTIDVWHMTVEITERILVDVLECADPDLAKQQHLAALLSALPLSDPALLAHWQQQARVYPHELSVAMLRTHLLIPPGWELEILAERHNLLVLYESLCTVEKHLLLVLMGLNRLYFPGWQWVNRLMEQLPIAPGYLAQRFKQVFAIVSIDPLAAVYQLHELIEETFALVETHLADFDTRPAKKRFREKRMSWENARGGLE